MWSYLLVHIASRLPTVSFSIIHLHKHQVSFSIDHLHKQKCAAGARDVQRADGFTDIAFHKGQSEITRPHAMAIAAGVAHSCCLTRTGVILAWRSWDSNLSVQEVSAGLAGKRVVSIAAGVCAHWPWLSWHGCNLQGYSAAGIARTVYYSSSATTTAPMNMACAVKQDTLHVSAYCHLCIHCRRCQDAIDDKFANLAIYSLMR